MLLNRSIKFAALVALSALITLVPGCGGDDVPDPDVAPKQPVPITLEERANLPEGFPIEIPALSAKVIQAEMTGDPDVGPWHYVLESESSPEDVVAWYREAYAGRSWHVVTDVEEADGYALALTKGAGAWSIVRVSPSGEGSRVECWAGIGVPVPPEVAPPTAPEALDV